MSEMKFETQTCSRCGGSGHYSYCQMYGTTCFKCRGAGKVYTPRGIRARQFHKAMLSKAAKNIQVGEQVWVDGDPFGAKAGWDKVVSVHADELNPGTWVVESEHLGHHLSPETMIRVRATSPEQATGAMEIALAYQSLLSKAGKEPAWLKTIAW